MLINGDCLQILQEYNDNTFDLIVTDPPYGIAFMGKDWDKALPKPEVWTECFRVLKEGKMAFIMCSPRQDVLSRMIISLETAGFRTNYTSIYWTYASGFPKAANISKLIDKKVGLKGEVIGKGTSQCASRLSQQHQMVDKDSDYYRPLVKGMPNQVKEYDITKPATEQAKKMEGAYVGFQPKPAVEVILVVSKGKSLTWLDDCRIPYSSDSDLKETNRFLNGGNNGLLHYRQGNEKQGYDHLKKIPYQAEPANQKGRFPANLLVSDDVLNDGSIHKSGKDVNPTKGKVTGFFGNKEMYYSKDANYGDSGSYSRYFDLDKWYSQFIITPKASKSERNKGCEDLPEKRALGYGYSPNSNSPANGMFDGRKTVKNNNHPTVKPLKLMSYLITMGSRENDIVLDPFVGSGTTYLAATELNRKCIGIELNPEYLEIAKARLVPYLQQTKLL